MLGESDLDTVLRVLADSERRKIVKYLTIADDVVINRGGEEHWIALLHSHLPLLSDHDYIEYDHEGKKVEIRRGENWADIKKVYRAVINGVICLENCA